MDFSNDSYYESSDHWLSDLASRRGRGYSAAFQLFEWWGYGYIFSTESGNSWDCVFVLSRSDIDATEEETPPDGGIESRTMQETPYHRTTYPTDEDDDPG